ncbi:glycolate oxidase subunit GlcE [Undibacterium arcticum]|uniref:Glycolate oxidase subunit GlcE n=1 Tax=Undibacterium arcticum TaxID=1762892 RepID=A0ABV7F6V0_9BURK
MTTEQVQAQFRERILAASAGNTALRIHGGGSKDWYGQALHGELLDTRAYDGIVDYEPTELVITARCGTPLAVIEAALAERNQMLAFEPPHFGAGATIGGVVASGLSGPRRQAAGAVRDFMLGAVLMDGKGEVLHFGGQVMKNVAGYDVSRLLAGSLGSLGLILEVSLKVLPKPFAETTRRFAMPQHEALWRLNEWGAQPLPISASAWHDGVLTLRLSGADAAVKAAARKLGGESVDDGAAFWLALREHALPFFRDGKDLWRLSLPSHAPQLVLGGEQMIEWGGAQRWLKTSSDANSDAAGIRASVAAAAGHACLFRGGDKSVGVFQPLAPAVARIHRNLKNAFDPAGIFNPGRMYPGL